MELVERSHTSGLVLCEESRDEPWLRRALRRIDPQLRLLEPRMVYPGTPNGYWRVVRVYSDDQPAIPVLTWMDADGDPIPVSAGILDEVDKLRRDGRNKGPSVEERNADLAARVQREREQAREAIHDEYEPYLERGRVGVGMSTGKTKPYWMRRYRGGER